MALKSGDMELLASIFRIAAEDIEAGVPGCLMTARRDGAHLSVAE